MEGAISGVNYGDQHDHLRPESDHLITQGTGDNQGFVEYFYEEQRQGNYTGEWDFGKG